ncbi:MAG TPA: hypothetical protein VNA16_00735 [Abditibacteriaceae bacterium]|nr:hypothetical protein [Abditibacteriaceae bacterium]
MKFLQELQLSRLGDATEAGLWVTSLPWPRSAPRDIALGARRTYCKPLGQWPGETELTPRRLLLIADGGSAAGADRAPERISLSDQPASTEYSPPSAEFELFERSRDAAFVWERHLLRLRWGDKSVGLAMGLRTGAAVHWWETCRLVVLEETPQCLTVEMGGCIPLVPTGLDDLIEHPGFSSPFLHKHNWLNGHIYARLHANGVCEVFAHHINSKFYDDGLALEDAVPVVGIRTDAGPHEIASLSGVWDGQRDELEVGGVRFDLSEAARLATPEQPGRLDAADGFLVWQPYQGVDIYGGKGALAKTGDAFLCHAEDHVIPRGVARTLRFSLSLSDRSPRVVRYLAPAWWYGVCEEFMAEPLLPVANEYDEALDHVNQSVREHIVARGFEDGSVPAGSHGAPGARYESGWKGDMPYAQLLMAWRTGDAVDYENALRSAYYFTDVGVDHAAKMARMQGYPAGAFSVTLNRVQGCIAAYLETGDAYLVETAQAVLDNTFWTHKNAWPRMAVGRDACFISSAVLMYRYFASDHYQRMAYEACLTVHHAQKPDGSFGDQGGGAGIHGWGAYITKPWMGLLAVGGVLDYLELFPDESPLLDTVKKFADWLMAARFAHDGVMGWSYQHDYDGQTRYYEMYSARWVELPTPGLWHQETLGRLLTFCTLRFADPAYINAWAESHSAANYFSQMPMHDYGVTAALQWLPWVQAKLWRARLGEKGMRIQPLHFGPRTPRTARLMTPAGLVEVAWSDDGDVVAPPQVEVG